MPIAMEPIMRRLGRRFPPYSHVSNPTLWRCT